MHTEFLLEIVERERPLERHKHRFRVISEFILRELNG